jgi:uroporphyrinogen-III synthase
MNVILTHSSSRFENLQSLLEQRGFSVVHHPLVRTQTIPDLNLESILQCSWWLFTSVAAVEALEKFGVLRHRKVAAVGAATANALQGCGANVGFVATLTNAASFAKGFLELEPQAPVALLEGDQALPTLRQAFAEVKLEFRALTVYRTLLNSWDHLGLSGQVGGLNKPNAVVLMSPTAVSVIPDAVAQVAELVALGHTTAASIQARGWSCVVAQKPEMDAVIEVLEALKDRRSNARFN